MMGMRKLLVFETNLKERFRWNSVKISCTTAICICFATPGRSIVTLLRLQHMHSPVQHVQQSTAKVAAAMHTFSTTCMLTMRLQHVRLSTHQVPQRQGFMHLIASYGVSYQEALVVGHVHCWLTSWWQVLNTLYLQTRLRVTQAATRRVNGSMGVMEQQGLCRCQHVMKPDALIQLTHTEPTLTP